MQIRWAWAYTDSNTVTYNITRLTTLEEEGGTILPRKATNHVEVLRRSVFET